MSAKDDGEQDVKRALLAAHRHLQEAVVTLTYAGFRAPEMRQELQTQVESLIQVAEAILRLNQARLERSSPMAGDIPNHGE